MQNRFRRSRETPRDGLRRRLRALSGLLALLLAGCGGGAGISTADRLSGTIPRPLKVTDARAQLGEADFPNLASVPDGPPPTTSLGERSRVLASLESDRTTTGGDAARQEADQDAQPNRGHIADIYFPERAADLDDQDQAVLRAVAELQSRGGGRLRVVGHSSAGPAGEAALDKSLTNFQISLARANSVAEALVRLGVARDRLLVEARSDSQPVYRETSEAGAAGNRRVEIFQEFEEAAR